MRKDDLSHDAMGILKDYLNTTGSILYSSHTTLKKGDIYFLGFNPGGESGEGSTLSQSIEAMFSNTENAYLDESWDNGNGEYFKGEAPLQLRVDWLFTQLGYKTRDICASNLIFERSPSAPDLEDWRTKAKACWKLHTKILELIKPKLILTMGVGEQLSTYSFLRSELKGIQDTDLPDSGHKGYFFKGFQWPGKNVYVAGIPHLSYYEPKTKSPEIINSITEWLKSKLEA